MAGRYTRSGTIRTPGPAFVPQSNQMAGNHTNRSFNQPVKQEVKTPQSNNAVPPPPELKEDDPFDLEQEEGDRKMRWKKNKGQRTKVSKSVLRSRRNKRLRKLLTPKNALMVLNELHIPNVPEYRLGHTVMQPYLGTNQYQAEVVINGVTYMGQGSSKILAKNNAAEKALRELVLEKMKNERQKESAMEGEDVVMGESDDKADDSQVPMLHLASYALHKLFTEWKIPLVANNISGSNTNLSEMKMEMGETSPVKKHPKIKTELPANALSLHPAMLLSQMRPGCQYEDIGVEGTAPNNAIFTVGVSVDGQQFLGSAKNKKEARRRAALSACSAIFGLQYPEPEPVSSAA